MKRSIRYSSTAIPHNVARLMPGAEPEKSTAPSFGIAPGETPKTPGERRTERKLHEDILAYLRQHDIEARHDRMDRKTTCAVGWPDIIFAIRGQACALEVKMPGRRVTEEQAGMMVRLVRNDWKCRVVHSLIEAINFIREVEQERGL